MKAKYEKEQRPLFADEKSFYDNYGVDPKTMLPGVSIDSPTYKFQRDVFNNLFGTYQPPAPAPAPAAASEAPAPAAPEAPAPEAPAPDGGTPIDSGGGIDQPTTGSVLGGALLNPPAYWVGGMDSYNKAAKPTNKTGDTSGSLTTTQT